MVRFVGLRPLQTAAEIIQIDDTPLGFVDLHNECDFAALSLVGAQDGRTHLVLAFVKVSGAGAGKDFSLEFEDVRRLSLTQETCEHEESTLFHSMECVAEEEAFTIETGGLTVSFTSASLTFSSST